jgi:surface carbohydrate biosynthesis protein
MIGIVVDHPSRDLPSLSILASEFIKKNIKVALIPSYKIEHALLDNPGVFKTIIFNFYRLENYKTILYAKSKNINVAVLDQESIAGHDGLGLADTFKKPALKENIKFVDHYFFPSKLIMKECLKNLISRPSNCIVSGYQRLDIVKKKKINVKEANFILICTNLPIANPGFTKKEGYITDTIKYGTKNISKEEVKKNYLQIRKSLIKLTKEIPKILNAFKSINFIIRPHPFENAKFWKFLEKYKNCKVTNKLNSFEWIIKCKALLHLDCTTSIEASLLNKPSISLLYTQNHRNNNVFKLAHECSYLCKSLPEVKNKLKLSIENKLKPKNPLNIGRFFFSPKNLSSTIIVENILSKSNRIKFKKKIRLNLQSYIKFFLEKYFGNKFHDFFLLLYRGKFVAESRKAKYFSIEQIKNYIDLNIKIEHKKFFFTLQKK